MTHTHAARHVVVLASLLSVAGVLGAGCAKLHYDVVAPAQARGSVVPNAGTPFTKDGIEYEVFQADQQVVIHYINRTGHPLRLTSQSSMRDSSGHAFAVDPEDIAPDQSGRLVVPPAYAADRNERQPLADEVRVGGYDEGGMVRNPRDDTHTTPEQTPGFRWPDGGMARFRLVFEPISSSATTAPTSEPKTLTHEWVLTRGK